MQVIHHIFHLLPYIEFLPFHHGGLLHERAREGRQGFQQGLDGIGMQLPHLAVRKIRLADVVLRGIFLKGRQLAGHLLEALQFHHHVDQGLAGVFLVPVLAVGQFGQEHARFDLQKARRHDQKAARDLQVELGHGVQVRDVLVRYGDNGDVVYVYLFFFNQMDQQIQRSFEIKDLYHGFRHKTPFRRGYRPP